MSSAHPVLSCDEARAFEAALFAGEESREWEAMQRAGRAVADAVLGDFLEIGGFPSAGRLLVLVGKGHNGGDALIAARHLLERHPAAQADVVFASGERALRPLAARAAQELWHSPAAARVRRLADASGLAPAYDLVLDGVFGFRFRAPLDRSVADLLRAANRVTARLRAAVDLPSGLDTEGAFHADFTYATGIVKAPLLDLPNAGRPRYLDLGFWAGREHPAAHHVLTPAALDPLRALRPARSDKRDFGHVFLIGGSRSYPGAILMSVLAALRGGAGLVTAFVPESLAPAYAARAPEAMWVGWPETADGGLAPSGICLLHEQVARSGALVIGPGLDRAPKTLALAEEIVSESHVPVVIDADALQPKIVRAGKAPRILTPHAGELARLEGAGHAEAVMVHKGPVTRITSGAESYHGFFGGPVLARGGSGDVLAGLIGALLAQTPDDPLWAACRGVVWHGMAADALARAHGQTAVQTTQLLDFLPAVLRT